MGILGVFGDKAERLEFPRVRLADRNGTRVDDLHAFWTAKQTPIFPLTGLQFPNVMIDG